MHCKGVLRAVVGRSAGVWLLALPLLLTSCGGTADAKRGVANFRARAAQTSFSEIYWRAAPEFRQSATEEQFLRVMTALNRKLGAWTSAGEPGWNVSRGTAGQVVNLTYQSQFAKGAVSEQFTWRIEDGEPILLGYHVNSPLLITE
jgi:hypothetical protein